jgi:hypothetical protein
VYGPQFDTADLDVLSAFENYRTTYPGAYSIYRKEGKPQNKLCGVHKTRAKERIYLLVQ